MTRKLGLLAASLLLLALLVAVARSRLPMRGAEVFGAIVGPIKGHPGATLAAALIALAALWLTLGVLAVAQEWHNHRRSSG